jgi:hypothetical protein
MQIERTDAYKPQAVPDSAVAGLGKTDGPAPDAAKAAKVPAQTTSDASRAYVRLAASAPQVNLDAVAEARRLLESGELAMPDRILRAAEKILRDGI